MTEISNPALELVQIEVVMVDMELDGDGLIVCGTLPVYETNRASHSSTLLVNNDGSTR
uniref:Uncharacterized protein n=1 Tax=Oryza sativa subsp. japonica TaxID=39947 RepID=Q2R1Q0_ORYSJ|nr:hypothetical protein LOC_Os11g38470 [Oryza sativa Japonica Group]